jgi:hypothetical protein
MIPLLALAPLLWVLIAGIVTALMGRRGFDRTAWFITGLLFGPLALVFVAFELLAPPPGVPRIVQQGDPSTASDALVVVFDGAAPVRERVTSLLEEGRVISLARTLPFDGARAIEADACRALRGDARELGVPDAELVVLYGPVVRAICDRAAQRQVAMVLTDRRIAGLDDCLASCGIGLLDTGRVHSLEPRPSADAAGLVA